MKYKNIKINIEKQNGDFKKKGLQKNYFFYYRVSKFIEKLKYQNSVKKFHKKSLLTNISSLQNYLNKKPYLKFIEKNLNTLNLFSNVKANSLKSQDKPEHIAILYYCDHFLFISKLWKSEQKGIVIEGVIELPIPAKVIGDNLITNIDELIELALDSCEVLKLSNPPLLVVLASSLFNIKSFKKEDVKIIEEKKEIIKSKSPYLPEDTFTEFQIFEENTFNAIYVRKT